MVDLYINTLKNKKKIFIFRIKKNMIEKLYTKFLKEIINTIYQVIP